jgi:Spy/CpxP family protein refolding chaperone
MKRLGLVLGGLAALVLAGGVATAKPKAKAKPAARPAAKAAKPAKSGDGGKQAKKGPIPDDIPAVHVALADLQPVLAAEVKLADDQKAKLNDKVASAQAALAKWDKDNAARRDAATAELEKTREGADVAAIDAAMFKVQAIRAEREKAEADQQNDVLAVLTPEQKNTWEGYRLYAGLLSIFGKFDLDLNQMDKVRGMGNAAAKELAGATDEAARADGRKKLMNAVIAEVLTERQRDQITGKGKPEKTAKSDKPRKAGGDKPKPKKGDKKAGAGGLGGDAGGGTSPEE